MGLDTLAVAVVLGLRGVRPFRPAVTFALFEAAMPLIGLLIGRFAGERFETPAVVLGGGVLIAVAAWLLKEALEDNSEADDASFATLRTAALAGFGISMDELAIGFPMGTSGLPVPETIAAIAVPAFVVTTLGMAVGSRLGATLGRRTARLAEIAAAIAFAALGAYLIAQRLMPGLPEI